MQAGLSAISGVRRRECKARESGLGLVFLFLAKRERQRDHVAIISYKEGTKRHPPTKDDWNGLAWIGAEHKIYSLI